ncbi:WD repeat protein [Schizosaccharomyces japonicus yFS275]|uniref:WD repeat protein n=1 Tax=Schizosaccharomyces japonicus (strain yFS275 / FY16936) TaxID=402676 RepID=B6JYD9_SCHJY|nr:WD repeat protein [Schizosaccharomyces japonicus yFS275]EEB06557.1 WD repeat protein [Schizosaccharomyces japonicus yFS275]
METPVLSSFRPSQILRDNSLQSTISCVDYNDTGELLVTGCDTDGTMHIYQCLKSGAPPTKISCKNHGVSVAKFTHHSNNLLHSSPRSDHSIRYFSTHDDTYISMFSGHKATVTDIQLSPVEDQFLSTGLDKTVKLWDLQRGSGALGSLSLPGTGIIAYDPTGLVFAVACYELSTIYLYDVRNYDKEPFSTFTITDDRYLSRFSFPPRMPEWRHIEFSNDGKFILLATKTSLHYVLDAYTGDIIVRLENPPDYVDPSTSWCGNVCFTPQDPYVIGTVGDRRLNIWNLKHMSSSHRKKMITPESYIESQSAVKPSIVKFNPRYLQLATAGSQLVLWLPSNHNPGSDASAL